MKSTSLTLWIFAMLALAMSCKNSKAVTPSSSVPSRWIVILLVSDAVPVDFEKAFFDYKIKHLTPTSRSENRRLFSFDNNIISSNDFLEKVKKSTLVKEAEFAYLVTKQGTRN